MICSHCGKELMDDSVFCQYCGKSLIAQKEETTETEVQGEPSTEMVPIEPAPIIETEVIEVPTPVEEPVNEVREEKPKAIKKLAEKAGLKSFIALLVLIAIALAVIAYYIIRPSVYYNKCEGMMLRGEWQDAVDYIHLIDDKRCNQLLPKCYYKLAESYANNEKWNLALEYYQKTDYNDASEKVNICLYNAGKAYMETQEWEKASTALKKTNYMDASQLYDECMRHINADFAFQQDFENAYYDNIKSFTDIALAQLKVIEQYSGKKFYDPELEAFIRKYKRVLEDFKSCSYSLGSEVGLNNLNNAVTKYLDAAEANEMLLESNKDFGFFENDNDALEKMQYNSKLAYAYAEVNNDIGNQVKSNWSYSSYNNGWYIHIYNNTAYSIKITYRPVYSGSVYVKNYNYDINNYRVIHIFPDNKKNTINKSDCTVCWTITELYLN